MAIWTVSKKGNSVKIYWQANRKIGREAPICCTPMAITASVAEQYVYSNAKHFDLILVEDIRYLVGKKIVDQ